jgi:hypothetical protein
VGEPPQKKKRKKERKKERKVKGSPEEIVWILHAAR